MRKIEAYEIISKRTVPSTYEGRLHPIREADADLVAMRAIKAQMKLDSQIIDLREKFKTNKGLWTPEEVISMLEMLTI